MRNRIKYLLQRFLLNYLLAWPTLAVLWAWFPEAINWMAGRNKAAGRVVLKGLESWVSEDYSLAFQLWLRAGQLWDRGLGWGLEMLPPNKKPRTEALLYILEQYHLLPMQVATVLFACWALFRWLGGRHKQRQPISQVEEIKEESLPAASITPLSPELPLEQPFEEVPQPAQAQEEELVEGKLPKAPQLQLTPRRDE